VSTNIATGHNLGDVVERIKETITPIVTAQGAHLEISGQFEAQQSAQKTMVIFGSLVFLIMILMLKMALGDFRSVFLVMLNLPLAMIGGVLAMFWVESSEPWLNLLAWFGLGRPFVPPVVSVATLVGFITLFGISVRNGILLVNHFRWLMVEEGLSHMDAVLTGSKERLIPVLMTALSAMLGLIPLARKMGEPGSELLAPLAVVVLGGLFSSTVLNMLVVPVGHLLFCGGKSARREKIKIEL
jgi:HME family heavy-metal exporter